MHWMNFISADHFSQYGIVNTSNVSRAVHNTMKKNFGFVNFKVCVLFKGRHLSFLLYYYFNYAG